MIEVEIKVCITDAQKTELIKGAEFISEESLVDEYYDSVDFSLTTNGYWLRRRNGEFELKLPATKSGGFNLNKNIPMHEIYDKKIIALAAGVDHLPTRLTVMAERNVLARLHPGCHAPIGVFAELDNSDIIIRAFVADPNGQTFIRKQVQGRKDKAAQLADQLADELIRSGAAGLIDKEPRQ